AVLTVVLPQRRRHVKDLLGKAQTTAALEPATADAVAELVGERAPHVRPAPVQPQQQNRGEGGRQGQKPAQRSGSRQGQRSPAASGEPASATTPPDRRRRLGGRGCQGTGPIRHVRK